MSSKNYPYVYILQNNEYGYFYIGYRCANKYNASLDTSYMGSSTNPLLNQYKFEKKIIAEFFDKVSAIKFELQLINENKNNPLMLNKVAWPHYTMLGKTAWNKGSKGLQKWAPGTYEKIYTKETREKMSLIKKGKPPWNKGRSDLPKQTEEANKKRSNSLIGVPKVRCSCVLCHKNITSHSLWRHYAANHQITE